MPALVVRAVSLAFAAAAVAPMAAFAGLWVSRAADPALAETAARLRPSSIVLASGLALAMALIASPASLAGFLLCGVLAGSAAADRDHFVLPDILTLAAITLGLAFRPFDPFASRLQLLITGSGLYIFGTGFAWAMRAWRGRAAFGQGDVKLIAGLGVILPASLIGLAVLAGSASALASVCLSGRAAGQPIALGLHLVVGTAVTLGAAAVFPSLLAH